VFTSLDSFVVVNAAPRGMANQSLKDRRQSSQSVTTFALADDSRPVAIVTWTGGKSTDADPQRWQTVEVNMEVIGVPRGRNGPTATR
jgi:hypothetical protein